MTLRALLQRRSGTNRGCCRCRSGPRAQKASRQFGCHQLVCGSRGRLDVGLNTFRALPAIVTGCYGEGLTEEENMATSKSSAALWLGLGLCASIALNVYQWWGTAPPPKRKLCMQLPSEALSRAEQALETQQKRATTLARQLKETQQERTVSQGRWQRCEQQRWKMTSWLLDALFSGRRSGQLAKVPAPPIKRRASLRQSGPAAQRASLCRIAEQHLRQHWSTRRTKIAEYLMQVAASPSQRQRVFEREMLQLQQQIGLPAQKLDALRGEYEQSFMLHMQRLQKALEQRPVSWLKVESIASGLFKEQDRLVRVHHGRRALARFRQQRLDQRTAIKALLGQYAGRSWNKDIAW